MHYRSKITVVALAFLGTGASAQAAPAAENWENHCAKCHGSDGKAQTKLGKKLQLKDYTDAKVQAGLTDKVIVDAIASGVFDQAGKEKMKAYRPVLSEDEIREQLAYIRKMKI
jgi:cytochrome c6